jgi:hypothetical protein
LAGFPRGGSKDDVLDAQTKADALDPFHDGLAGFFDQSIDDAIFGKSSPMALTDNPLSAYTETRRASPLLALGFLEFYIDDVLSAQFADGDTGGCNSQHHNQNLDDGLKRRLRV